MHEEELLISCGMTPIRKLSSIGPSICRMTFHLSLVSISRLEQELELEPTDQLPSQTLFLRRVA